MEFLQFTRRETRIATERHLKFQGTAKVNVDEICFNSQSNRQLDQKNIDRLCRIFQEEGCQNLSLAHHVPATVCRRHLTASLERANVSARALLTNSGSNPPNLQFQPGQLKGLHGRHRIAAGLETLPPDLRWWAVDIYSDGIVPLSVAVERSDISIAADIGDDLKTTLIEEYSNEKPPSDGEIYRKIRQYASDGNLHGELRWKARLCPNNRTRLESLAKNTHLRQAFDGVLGIPGHRSAMWISMLHRVVAVKCDEEIAHYLNYVKDFWYALVDNKPSLVAKIDQHTVEELELMAPCVEAKKVQGLILSGQVFADFDENERAAIWEKLQLFNGLVPSLHSFFEDFKCFENWAHCLKRLFTVESTICGTMRQLKAHSNANDGTCLIQISESSFANRTVPAAKHFELAYQQVWLYAIRHYPQMPRDAKRKNRLAKPQTATADECVVSDMARLACRVGFKSDEIKDLIRQSPDRMIASKALLKARKPDCFVYDNSAFDTLIDRIVDCFATAKPKDAPTAPPVLMGPLVKRKARCGHPTEQALLQDRPRLFLDYMQAAETPNKITTFFVRRCVYLAFFGPQPTICQRDSTSPPSAADSLSSLPPSPLFVLEDGLIDDLSEEQDPLNDRHTPPADRLQTEVGQPTAEQERLQREVEAREQERLQREAEAREQKRLQREAEAREQERLQREAEAREQERLQREAQERSQREANARIAAEQAAVQERLQREAKRAAAEQESKRLWEEWRAIAILAVKQGRERLQINADRRARSKAVAKFAAREGRELQQRKAQATREKEANITRPTQVEERARSHTAEVPGVQKEGNEQAAPAANAVHTDRDVEMTTQVTEIARHVKEAEDFLTSHGPEPERLRGEAAERAGQDAERLLTQEADQRVIEVDQHNEEITGSDEDLNKMLQDDAEPSGAGDHDMRGHNDEIPDGDENLDGMLRDGAEPRAAEEHDMQDHNVEVTGDENTDKMLQDDVEQRTEDDTEPRAEGDHDMQDHDDETIDDETIDDETIVQDDAEQRMLGSHDIQDRTRLEAEQEQLPREATESGALESMDNEQGDSQREEERAAALAQLQTTAATPPGKPEDETLLAELSRPVTQLDLPSLIARWREVDNDNVQSSRNTGERTSRGQRQSRAVGIQNSRMKARSRIKASPTQQAAIRETKPAWDLEEPDPTVSADTAVLQVARKDQDTVPSGQEGAGGSSGVAASSPQQEVPAIEVLPSTPDNVNEHSGGDISEPGDLPHPSAKNNELAYDPARSPFEELTRKSTLIDPHDNLGENQPWPSQLSVPPLETAQGCASGDDLISITFYIYEHDQWKVDKVLSVDPSDRSELEWQKTVWGYMRRKILLFDMNMRAVSMALSFRAATANGVNALLLIPMEDKDRQAIEPPRARRRIRR